MNRPTGPRPRNRLHLALGLVGVVALGLASRHFAFLWPAVLDKYPGDALWALMVLLGIALIRPDLPCRRLALLALGISYAVEFAQLYHAPWIDAIRATRLGRLALGSTFNWPDLLAYTVGVAIGFAFDRRRPGRPAPAATAGAP